MTRWEKRQGQIACHTVPQLKVGPGAGCELCDINPCLEKCCRQASCNSTCCGEHTQHNAQLLASHRQRYCTVCVCGCPGGCIHALFSSNTPLPCCLQDVQFGPFSGQQLCKFHRSGVWAPDFPVCYGPAAVWLPIWLVLQLLGLDSQQPPKAAAAAAAAPARKQPVQTSSTAVAERHEEEYTATRRVRHKYHASGQHEKIAGSPGASWRLSSSIQTSPAAAAAAAAGARSSRHLQAGSDGMTDAETEEMSAAEMLAEVAALRQDSAYIEELSRAVDMDWEPLQQQQQQLLPQASGMPSDDASDFPATGLAGLGGICGSRGSPRGSTAAAQQLLLQLVVDTNVLLNSKGLLLLQQLQEAQHGGCGVLQLLVVLPWTVLVELDKLKTRERPSRLSPSGLLQVLGCLGLLWGGNGAGAANHACLKLCL